MSKSIWRLRNMACHLTFRQESRPCTLSLPLSLCLVAPASLFPPCFGCGKHTVQLHLQLPQNKRCTLKTVARCTFHMPHAPHTAITSRWSCDCIDHWSVEWGAGDAGGSNALSPLCNVWQMIKVSASAWQDNWLPVPGISIKLSSDMIYVELSLMKDMDRQLW